MLLLLLPVYIYDSAMNVQSFLIIALYPVCVPHLYITDMMYQLNVNMKSLVALYSRYYYLQVQLAIMLEERQNRRLAVVKPNRPFVHFQAVCKYQPKKMFDRIIVHIMCSTNVKHTCFCPANIKASLPSIAKRKVMR